MARATGPDDSTREAGRFPCPLSCDGDCDGVLCTTKQTFVPFATFTGTLSLLVRDPAGTDPSGLDCTDTSVPASVAALIVSGQTPDGKRFVINKVFNPCDIGGGETIEKCNVDPFGCSNQGLRFGESALGSGVNLYLEDLTLLGIETELDAAFGAPSGSNPVIFDFQEGPFMDHTGSDRHASYREYHIGVKFVSTAGTALTPPTPPSPQNNCSLSDSFNTCCGDGFLDPGEECDDHNTADGDGCSHDCKIELGGGATASDADQDGIPDANDRCPQTPAGVEVDSAGCSQAQFCALVDATTAAGRKICRNSDWKNDEPLLNPVHADCRVDKQGNTCVPETRFSGNANRGPNH